MWEAYRYDLGKGADFYVNATQMPWSKHYQMYDYITKVSHIMIDQGTADEFYDEKQLLPENFKAACEKTGQSITLRMQEGYDHSYHFIASFIGEHIAYHAKALKA